MRPAFIIITAAASWFAPIPLRAEILVNPGFEAGTSGWEGRSCTIAAAASPVHSGGGAVLVAGRSKNWHSVRQEVTGTVQANGAGVAYTVSGWVRMATAGTHTVNLRLRTTGTNYDNKDFTATDAGWTRVSFTTPPIALTAGEQAWVEVANQTETASFYVDDCSLVAEGIEVPPAFLADPLVAGCAAVGVAYRGSLVDDLVPGSTVEPLFEKLSGPAWLTVAADGTLGGTPSGADLGLNEFGVGVAAGSGAVDHATLEVLVTEPAPMPFRDAFEDPAAWQTASGRAGWAVSADESPVFRPMTYVHGGEFPIPGMGHEQVLDIEEDGGVALISRLVHPEVLLDLMLQPSLRTDPAAPRVDAAARVAFFFNAAGSLVVHHAVHSGGFSSSERRWSVLDHPPVAGGRWVRLRITCDDGGDTLRGDRYFRVELDGVALVAPGGYSSPSPTDEVADLGGPFFLCANHGAGDESDGIAAVDLHGRMRVDDLSVSAPLSVTSSGTPFEWIERFFPGADPQLADLLDGDGDGSATWEEYLAGTDPTDAGSVLRPVIDESGGLPRLRWSGPLGGALASYRVERNSDLSPGGWQPVGPPLPRDPTGTNWWIDDDPPDSPSVFYRLVVGPE